MSQVSISFIINGQRFERQASGEENVRAAMAEAVEFADRAVARTQKFLTRSRPKRTSRKGAKAQRKK